jgi:hypothetical protein
MILAELALIRAELTSPASAPLTPIAPAQEITVEPETVVSAEEGPPAVPEIPRRKRPVI